MIIWGGYDDLAYLNTGGKYNPSGDSWSATSTTDAPTGRYMYSAVWAGTYMIVWGGYDDYGQLNTGGRYLSSSDSWSPTSMTDAPVERYSHTAVWTGTEMIIWGGLNDQPLYLNTGGRYVP